MKLAIQLVAVFLVPLSAQVADNLESLRHTGDWDVPFKLDPMVGQGGTVSVIDAGDLTYVRKASLNTIPL